MIIQNDYSTLVTWNSKENFFFYKHNSVKQLKKDQKPFKINFTISQVKNLNWLSDGRLET